MIKKLLAAVFVLALACTPLACGAGTTLTISNCRARSITASTAVIWWTTSEAATSQAEYGTTTAYGTTTELNTTLTTSHRVTINGLDVGTSYHYRVKSKLTTDNETISDDNTFATTIVVLISSCEAVNLHSTAATIKWDTNFPADSQVEYGTTMAYGTTTTLDTTLTTSHTVALTGLTPSAIYHYRVKSASATDDDVSADATFTMTAPVRLTAAITDEPSTLNPFIAAKYPQTAFLGIVMETLVLALEDGSMVPWLAEDWTVSTDGLEWTFNIDPDATWSDGQPVTADDVVYTYDLHFENTGWTQSSSIRALVKQDAGEPAADAITKINDNTVVFKLNGIHAPQIFLTAISYVFINPKHIWEPKIAALGNTQLGDTRLDRYAPEDETTFADEVIGSGPFKFAEYVDAQYVKYEANTTYWKGRPNIDEVVFRMFQEQDAALLAFRAGEIDALATVETPTDIPLLLKDPAIRIDLNTRNNHTNMLFLNMRKPPLHILDVRKAIDMTIDRQNLINNAVFGYASLPQQVPFGPGLAESNPDIAWVDQYVDTEGDLLDQATRTANANTMLDAIPGMSAYVEGTTRTWTDPVTSLVFDLEFDFNYIGAPTYQRGATEITKTMADIGITLNPAPFTSSHMLFSGITVWNYDFVIFGYPSPPEFDQLVKQWSNSPFGASYDGSVVGFNNNPDDPYIDNGDDKPGDIDGAKPQTYDTPDWDTATAAEKDLYKNIYDEIVAWATPIEEDLYATKLITDPVARLAAIMAVQQDFADALPILNMYHEYTVSAYRTDRFTGWDDMEGLYFYGFAPPTVSVKTLMGLSLK